MSTVVLVKSHVKGYSRKDGTYVPPHERAGEAHHPDAHPHPKRGENGKPVVINKPSHASAASTWHNPDAVATFLPDGDTPMSLHSVSMLPWKDAPTTTEGWDFVDGINEDLDEPPFTTPAGKKAAAGVVIEESDGRVWVIAPTNQFGGYEHSLPKGTAEPELSLQGNALKEAWEETGLQVEITGYLMDVERTTSMARFYTAKRVGGSPTDAGWETQAVSLVPKSKLHEYLHHDSDKPLADAVTSKSADVLLNASKVKN